MSICPNRSLLDHKIIDLVLAGHVRGNQQIRMCECAAFFFELLWIDVRQDKVYAFLFQLSGDRQADSATRAGYERYAPANTQVHENPLKECISQHLRCRYEDNWVAKLSICCAKIWGVCKGMRCPAFGITITRLFGKCTSVVARCWSGPGTCLSSAPQTSSTG